MYKGSIVLTDNNEIAISGFCIAQNFNTYLRRVYGREIEGLGLHIFDINVYHPDLHFPLLQC
jgi:hypothetical protein